MLNDELILDLASFSNDPLGFAEFAFPWGEAGSDLEHAALETWQRDWLAEARDELQSGTTASAILRKARTSGHGIGKSALVSILILWAMSTHEDTIGVVTANTETQLKTKTWVQLAKWYRLFIGRSLFKMTATALFSVDPEHERTWRFDMVPWSERNTEAFAGLHNKGKRILLVFDEASAIDDVIWEVAEGALTDEGTQIIWAVFGNPTKNKGRFRDCFPGGRFAHRWQSAAIDSREVTITNKVQIEEWINDYGLDHDFVRVRVRGIFPRVDMVSFISYELAHQAVERDVRGEGPVVIGVDVARFGDDASVIYPRQGRDASSREIEILRGVDTMKLASRVAAAFNRYAASVCFVDAGGVGGGVVDRLRQLNVPVIEVDFGSSPEGTNPDDGAKYKNKRAEIYGALRSWLAGGSIPNLVTATGTTLLDELTGPGFSFNTNEEIVIESKKDMRRRNVASPNVADALATTFAAQVYIPARDETDFSIPAGQNYNPFTKESIYELSA